MTQLHAQMHRWVSSFIGSSKSTTIAVFRLNKKQAELLQLGKKKRFAIACGVMGIVCSSSRSRFHLSVYSFFRMLFDICPLHHYAGSLSINFNVKLIPDHCSHK